MLEFFAYLYFLDTTTFFLHLQQIPIQTEILAS